MRRPVELHIGELVLHGFDPHERHAIGDAVQAELARLIEEHGLGHVSDGDVVRLDGGAFVLRAGAGAAGEGIARAVYAALGGKRP